MLESVICLRKMIIPDLPDMPAFRYDASDQVRFHQELYLRRRRISHYRFLWMESGRGEFCIAGMRFKVSSGWLGLLPPGWRENRYLAREPVSYLWVEFAGPGRLLPASAVEMQAGDPQRSALVGLLKTIDLLRQDRDGCLLAAAVRLMLPEPENPATTRIDPRLSDALRMIQDAPEGNPTVTQLADAAGLSEPHFRRLFRAELGMSPKQYLIRTRMEFAQRLLQFEGLRVTEAAALLGYRSVYPFSAQYRRVMGRTPSADRRAADEE